jgi:hypothetical protein
MALFDRIFINFMRGYRDMDESKALNAMWRKLLI